MSSQQTSARACKADKNNKLVFHPIIFSSFCASSVFSSLTCLTSDWVPMTRRFWWDTHGARWPANQLPTNYHGAVTFLWSRPSSCPPQHQTDRSPLSVSLGSACQLPATNFDLWPLVTLGLPHLPQRKVIAVCPCFSVQVSTSFSTDAISL